MNAPTIEERVYLSPWEDGTERPPNSTEDLAAQTNSVQNMEDRDNQSQIATEGLELIDDFLGQSEETDTTQFAEDAESDVEMDPDLFTDISTLLDDEGKLAEDVMNAYLEALRSLDVEVLLTLIAGAAKEAFEKGYVTCLKWERYQKRWWICIIAWLMIWFMICCQKIQQMK